MYVVAVENVSVSGKWYELLRTVLRDCTIYRTYDISYFVIAYTIYFSSLLLANPSQMFSSNSSSDESDHYQGNEPVTSPPAKTSSSSTSTSKTSSPLGSLTRLSLPSKPKSSTRQRPRQKKSPPLARTPPLVNSSDSFASVQDTSIDSFVSAEEEKWKHEQSDIM